MPVIRHRPGERAPFAGTYALVGHYGEAMNLTVWADQGDRLPLLVATGPDPVWFVRISEAEPASEAA